MVVRLITMATTVISHRRASLFLSFLLFISVSFADLPIHCRNGQVAGKWTFTRSTKSNGNGETCGFSTPDDNAYHFTHSKDITFVPDQSLEITITLTQPNIVTAVDSSGTSQGTWTMVYDEGFEVNVGGHSYFAFMLYKPRKDTALSSEEVSDYISYCDQTMVGWYHDETNNFGCFRGSKSDSGNDDNNNGDNHQSDQSSSFRETSAIHHYNIVSPVKRVDGDAFFQPNYEFVETQNADRASTWTAGVHEHFLGKRVKEMMSMLGSRHYRKGWEVGDADGQAISPGALPSSDADDEDLKKFPESFSWKEQGYDSPVRNQGECGSCFAVAAVAVAETRLNVKRKVTTPDQMITLSPQSVVSCSRYNQGCNGGYPFLVGKHGEDFGFVEESCFPYEGTNSDCSKECQGGKRYKVTNHHYVGGYYGGCSEVEMMKEIMNGGPIVVAFQAPSSLFYYTGGIYTGPAPKSEGSRGHGLNIWEQTNHAVIAVGWGVDSSTQTKYWEIKNTWGTSWGEGGYFRIKRGSDECGIESMASTFDIADG